MPIQAIDRPNFDFHRERWFEREAMAEAVPALAPLKRSTRKVERFLLDERSTSLGLIPNHF
ncbi:hypothetical protein [Pseudobacillus badius]|uniref:hypothetical protein n=1 Tax=Bacillus badius TaxID=1455 RepID=UPI001CC00928|nr:hypothetical protein [Bacillus badius]UAT29011.1 hypothetical protein K7T73_10260 [Bacillus badius]